MFADCPPFLCGRHIAISSCRHLDMNTSHTIRHDVHHTTQKDVHHLPVCAPTDGSTAASATWSRTSTSCTTRTTSTSTRPRRWYSSGPSCSSPCSTIWPSLSHRSVGISTLLGCRGCTWREGWEGRRCCGPGALFLWCIV